MTGWPTRQHWADLGRRLRENVAAHAAREPLAPGLPLEAARAGLGLPARQLVERLAAPPLAVRAGYVVLEQDGGSAPALPDRVLTAVRLLRDDLAGQPFAAPEAARLRELGLDSRSLAAAARAGLLLRVADQVVLAPGADREATRILAGLPGPFTAAEARQVLHTTRRVAIPLLEYLDRQRAHPPAARRPAHGDQGTVTRARGDRLAAGKAAPREPLAAPRGRLGGRLIRADPADQRLGRHRGEQDPGAVVPGGQPGVAETVDPVDDREPVGMPGPEAAPGVVGAQPVQLRAAWRTGPPGCCR